MDKDITWTVLSLLNFDPRTKQYEQEVQKIFYLQNIANQLQNAFTHSKEVTKSHILVVNALTWIKILIG